MDAETYRRQLALRLAYLKEQGLGWGLAPPALSPSPHRLPAGEGGRDRSEASEEDGGLSRIRAELGECRRCRLAEGRSQIVFGTGDPRARVLFVGEGPGADEDRVGEPFVGRAGQLLTDIIQKGMGLKRSEVYIANVVKCRPPENRKPLPDEMAACLPFLEAQIAAVSPEVIVALGATALEALLGRQAPITRVRGQWMEWRGVPLMPTFHPSYLLRNPAAKREVWLDIQAVMARLGLPPPGRKN